MARATVMDAFNAAGHFSNQVLGIIDEKKRKEADAWLSYLPANFTTYMEDRIRDNPFNYTGNPDDQADLDRYTAQYMSKMQNFAGQYYSNQLKGKEGIPYYQERVMHMQKQNFEKIANMAKQKQDKWRWDRENVRYEEDVIKHIATGIEKGLTPQQIMTDNENRLKVHTTRNEKDAQQINQMRRDAQRYTYQHYMLDKVGKIEDPRLLREEFNKARSAFDFMPKESLNIYDEAGNVTGTEESAWGFDGKDKFDEAVLQNRCMELFRGREDYFQRGLLNASSREDYERLIQFAKFNGSLLNEHYNNGNPLSENLSGEHKSAARGFFNWRNIEGHLKQKDGDKALQIPLNWRTAIEAAHTGKEYNLGGKMVRFENFEQTVHNIMALQKEAFMYEKRELPEATREELWQEKHGQLMTKFFDEFRNYLRDVSPASLNTYDKFTAKEKNLYIDEKSAYYSKEFLEDRGQSAIDFFMNMVYRQNILDHATMEREMNYFIGEGIFKKVKEEGNRRTANDIGGQIKNNARLSRELESPELDIGAYNIVRLGKNSFEEDGRLASIGFRDKDLQGIAERFAERERGRMALSLGGDIDDLVPEWMPSKKQKNDIQPKAQFRSRSTGELYYMSYDDNDKEVRMKFDKTKNEWVEDKNLGRPQSTGERVASQLLPKTFDNILGSLNNGKNPLNGEDFDIQKSPPPGSALSANDWKSHSVKKDEIWARYFRDIEAKIQKEPPPVSNSIQLNAYKNNWRTYSETQKRQLWCDYLKQQGVW